MSRLAQILHLSQQATFLTRNQGFEAYLTAENQVNDIGARSELTQFLVQIDSGFLLFDKQHHGPF